MATPRLETQAGPRTPRRNPPRHPTPAQVAAVDRELANASRQAAALSGPSAAALAPVLAQARREVAADLQKWLDGAPGGEERYTAQAYRNTLAQLDATMAALGRLHPGLQSALALSLDPAAQLAARHVAHELARFSDLFEGTVRTAPIRVAAVLADGSAYLLPRFAKSAAKYTSDARREIQRELAVGVVRGETWSQLIDRMMRTKGVRQRVVGQSLATGEALADGLFKRYRWWGERIVRTEVMSGYNTMVDVSIRETARHVPGLVRRWDAALDRRICKLCGWLHGKTAPLDGEFGEGVRSAPAHPNCRCRVGAWRSDWSEILAAAGGSLG